jgi:hypothetical protein
VTAPLLRPSKLPPLTGVERFTEGGATVLDFWRWALGDLRMNNARGYLVEFLVARAVGADDPIRIEWGAHDVTAPDGTRIEVKSCAYLQSWAQKKPSTPRFSLTGATSIWDDTTGTYRDDPTGRVDVWVFALHTCTEHSEYDPLDIGQWAFWAIPNMTVEQSGKKSAGISAIRKMAGEPVQWIDLNALIRKTADLQTRSPG